MQNSSGIQQKKATQNNIFYKINRETKYHLNLSFLILILNIY